MKLVALMLVFTAQPALALTDISLELVRLTPVTATTPLSGGDIVYEVRLQCAAVDESYCTNSVVEISPLPFEVAEIDVGAHPLLETSSFVRGTAGGAADGVLTLDLVDSIPAGTSMAIQFVLRTDNGRTPNGFTWTMPATATASNAPTVTASSDGTVYALAEISVTKVVLPDPPPVDYTVRYTINVCDPSDPSLPGNLYLDISTVIDTLPPGTVFVGASTGGVYDASAPHTVTWQLPDLGSKPCDTAPNLWIDVQFPSTIFGTVSPDVTEVDNVVEVSGLPYGATVPISDSDTLHHSFVDVPTPSGAAGKVARTPICCHSSGPYTYPGDWLDIPNGTVSSAEAAWELTFRNTGLTPLSVEYNDRLPCAYPVLPILPTPPGRAAHTSPLAGESVCTDPSFITESVSLATQHYGDALQNGYTPIWTSTSGATGGFAVTSTGNSRTNMEPVGLPAGEAIAEVRVPADPLVVFPPGFGSSDYYPPTIASINGHMRDEDLSGPWVNMTPVVNREDHQLYVGSDPVPPPGGAGSIEDIIRVLAPLFRAKISKNIGSDGTVSLYSSNQSAVAMPAAILTDLLPPGVTFNQLTYVALNSDTSATNAVNLEVIDNYAGTGRQLVRISLKPGFTIDPLGGDNDFTVRFTTHGLSTSERPAGSTTNTTQFHLPGGDSLASCISSSSYNAPPSTSDPYDLDGDGVTTSDNHCAGTTTVSSSTTSTFLVAEKYVQGNLDASLEPFPKVGSVDTPGGGTFELRLRNRSNVPLTNLVIYDVLPSINDYGVLLDAVPRESMFTALLETTPVVTGATAPVVEYSTATVPCRGELNGVAIDLWPASCTNDWSTTQPVPLSTVTAIRITGLGDLPPDPSDSSTADDRTISYTVTAPSGLAPGDIAWNSFAVAGDRVETGGNVPFLATEPPKVGIAVPQTDVELAKTVNGQDSASVPLGSIVDYALTVSHGTTVTVNPDGSVTYYNSAGSAPSIAPAVVVTDVIPAGVEIVAGSSSTTCDGNPGGTFNETTGVWTVGDINPGESFKLCYQAKVVGVVGTSTYINLAEVSAMGQGVPDIDSEPGNIGPTPVEDDEADAVVTVLVPAIDLEKQVLKNGVWYDADEGSSELPIFNSGEPIDYQFVVTNTGEVDLENVTVTDPLIDFFCSPAPIDLSVNQSRTLPCHWPIGWGAGTVVNTAFVTGDPVGGGDPVTDEDTAQVAIPDPTAVTIGEIDLQSRSLTDLLAGIGVDRMDKTVLLELLAAWDPDLAATLAGADRALILAALKRYLDPDGDGQSAVLSWVTLEERGTIGFFVDRREDGGAWLTITSEMLPGLITAPLGGEYRLTDPAARPGKRYEYLLIEQEARGTTRSYGPFDLEMPQ